jgi:hypothetical protein
MSSIDNLGILQELAFRREADLDIVLEIRNADDTEFDATGCQIEALVEARTGGASWAFDANMTFAANGIVNLRLSDAVTAVIPASPTSKMAKPIYDWAVTIILPDGTRYPFCYGPAYAI